MKKYRVTFKRSGKVLSEFASPEEASEMLMWFITCYNELSYSEDYFISRLDFLIEEVECNEVNEVITDFESAKKYIVGKTNDVFGVTKKLSKSIDPIKDAEILIKELNQKHLEALIALNRLFTIAEAWNKADGFVPDFSNRNQCKYFPWFIYNNAAAGFVCLYTHYSPVYASAYLGSRLCFKTEERAAQFGKQFIELYNKVFLITNK